MSNSMLKTTLDSCLDILRSDGIMGDKALRNLSYLLTLKLIEPHICNNKFNDHPYDIPEESNVSRIVDSLWKEDLLSMSKFSLLAQNVATDNGLLNIYENLKDVWFYILSVNPLTKHVFIPGNTFDIKRSATYKILIEKINSLEFKDEDFDVLGSTYEEIIKGIMTGKTLGQYFTPPSVKRLMINLIDPKINEDGIPETCCDPAMGTGGFLISYIRRIKEIEKSRHLTLPDSYLNECIYGKEFESDTFQLAVSNMLISSGKIITNLDIGDSIRDPINNKFDNILANPPFGIKGLTHDSINSIIKNQYVPIKTNNAVSLFLQAIIFMLKINGKCAVVLPSGKELMNNSFRHIREYLLKTCDLKEVIHLPSGTFTNTNISTCVFHFVKKREGTAIISINTKGKILYTFANEHTTTNVKFYDWDCKTGDKTFLIDVPITDIASNSYILTHKAYVIEVEEKYNKNVIVKTLNEICKFLPKSKRNAKYGVKEGLYPFFKSSLKVDSYVSESDYDKESLIIGDGGEPNINYGVKFSTSDHCYVLQNKHTSSINLKYVYYYLFHNLDMMKQFYTGVGIKNISKSNIEILKIPILPLERQAEIVAHLDLNNDIVKQLEKDIENNKIQAQLFMKNVVKYD